MVSLFTSQERKKGICSAQVFHGITSFIGINQWPSITLESNRGNLHQKGRITYVLNGILNRLDQYRNNCLPSRIKFPSNRGIGGALVVSFHRNSISQRGSQIQRNLMSFNEKICRRCSVFSILLYCVFQ